MDKKTMVDQNFIFKIVRELERFLIHLNEYSFNGSGYSLILFIPLIRSKNTTKFNLILSAKSFDKHSVKDIISKAYFWLDEHIGKESTSLIESIVIASTDSAFVRNLNFVIPTKDEIIKLNDFEVGEVKIDSGIIVNSNIANKLKIGDALTATLNDGIMINMGVKEIDQNLNIKYYTGKGLRELCSNLITKELKQKAKNIKAKGEDFLIQNSYLSTINVSDIRSIK